MSDRPWTRDHERLTDAWLALFKATARKGRSTRQLVDWLRANGFNEYPSIAQARTARRRLNACRAAIEGRTGLKPPPPRARPRSLRGKEAKYMRRLRARAEADGFVVLTVPRLPRPPGSAPAYGLGGGVIGERTFTDWQGWREGAVKPEGYLFGQWPTPE